MQMMKPLTFAIAFILTVCIVIAGVALSHILANAATSGNDFVFGLFLGPFFVLLFFYWVGEKLVLKVFKKDK